MGHCSGGVGIRVPHIFGHRARVSGAGPVSAGYRKSLWKGRQGRLMRHQAVCSVLLRSSSVAWPRWRGNYVDAFLFASARYACRGVEDGEGKNVEIRMGAARALRKYIQGDVQYIDQSNIYNLGEEFARASRVLDRVCVSPSAIG